jgi:beta-phosphoglucomutase
MRFQAALFDLDGVLVDTASLHFKAWREVAKALGIPFDARDNESIKGYGRRESLELILELGFRTLGETVELSDAEFNRWLEYKNRRYSEMVEKLSAEDVLPGVVKYLDFLKQLGMRLAVVSSSKNAARVLEKIGLLAPFELVIDGNLTSKSKPDPEGVLMAAERLGVPSGEVVLIEGTLAGIEAAKHAGMCSVAIGHPQTLAAADLLIRDFVSGQEALTHFLEIEEVLK